MISFERIDIKDVPWASIESIGERNIFQIQAWLNFLKEIHKAEPIITAVKSDGNVIGYFTGLIVRRYGLKILGSPFRGWTTYFMGFNLPPGTSYHEILQAFLPFVFNDLGCHYLEIIDPNIRSEDCVGLPYKVEALPWYAIDLTKSEEELFSSMKSAGRNCIRKSIKNGVVIEEAPVIGFAEEYNAEFTEVLSKKSMVPTYSLENVNKLINLLLPTGNLLLLRALSPDGRCIATGIFLGYNKTAVFWGAASWRDYQSLRPNEPIAWYGMKAMKARGIQVLHLGGECEQYKEKLGCYEVKIYRLMKAKNVALEALINAVMSQKSSRFRNWALRRL